MEAGEGEILVYSLKYLLELVLVYVVDIVSKTEHNMRGEGLKIQHQIDCHWILIPPKHLCTTVTDREARQQICHLTLIQLCERDCLLLHPAKILHLLTQIF